MKTTDSLPEAEPMRETLEAWIEAGEPDYLSAIPDPPPTVCPECGETLRSGSWPFCTSRANPTGHTPVHELNAQRFDPVVVFRKPDGSYSFPGDSRKPTPQGCERIELRTTREVRAFERQQAQRDHAEWERSRERDARFFEPLKSNSRADLRQKMQHFSPLGRAFAEAAMKRNNERPRARYDSGFHLEAFN